MPEGNPSTQINKHKKQIRYFKFWYQTNSCSEVMTDIMPEDDAMQWLRGNQQYITAIFIQERMTSLEAYKLLNRNQDDEE